MSERDRITDRRLVRDVCTTNLTPTELLELPERDRERYIQNERTKLRGNLRRLQFVLGAIEIIAAIIAFLVIYLTPIPTDRYLMCFYSLIGTPGVFLPLQLDLGCLSPFLLATITLLLHGLVYRILVLGVFSFNEYFMQMTGGKYDNRFRWIARGAVYPAYYLIALHVSGVRSFIASSVLLVIVFATEMFRWITERKRKYLFSRSQQNVVVSQTGKSAAYASVLFSGIVMSAQLAYWILFIAQDAAAVPLITWLYGISFLVLYGAFSIWVWYVTSQVELKYRARMGTEYGWEIFQTFTLLFLTTCAIVGSAVV